VDETGDVKKGTAVIILSPAAGRAADLGGRVEDGVLDAAVVVVRSSVAAV